VSELRAAFQNLIDNPFYAWIVDVAKEVNVVDVKSLDFKYPPRVLRSIRMKACYNNALIAAKKKSGVEYVLGFVIFSGIPIKHAWNKYENTYFDLTSEVLGRPVGDMYFSVVEMSAEKAESLGKLHSSASILQIYYEEEVVKSHFYSNRKPLPKSRKVTESIISALF
jgi:hypothetical protein